MDSAFDGSAFLRLLSLARRRRIGAPERLEQRQQFLRVARFQQEMIEANGLPKSRSEAFVRFPDITIGIGANVPCRSRSSLATA